MKRHSTPKRRERRRGRIKPHAAEGIETSPVLDVRSGGPQEREGGGRPNSENVRLKWQRDGSPNADDLYSEISDDQGQQYTLILCPCRKCQVRRGHTE